MGSIRIIQATEQISEYGRCVYHQKCKCHLQEQPRQSLCRPLRLHSLTCLPSRLQKQRGHLGIAGAECEQREQALGKGQEGNVELTAKPAHSRTGTCASASNHAPPRSFIHSFHPLLILLPVRTRADRHSGPELLRYPGAMPTVSQPHRLWECRTCGSNDDPQRSSHASGHTLADASLYSRRVAQIALCCRPYPDEAGSALTGRASNKDFRRGVGGGELGRFLPS